MEEQNSFDRDEVVSAITDNMDHEDVKAYLDRDHDRHNAVVAEVTDLVEQVFFEKKPTQGFLNQGEAELRQDMFDDPRSVRQQLEELLDNKTEWGKAYYDSGHAKHREAVKRAQILFEAKYDDAPRKDPDSRWPIHYRTSGQNDTQTGGFPHEYE
jgi:hypothetical protein